MTTPTTEAGKALDWPQTEMGKRLAGCPGSLPLGGEQERLPDGSLSPRQRMRAYQIARAIEREAAVQERERLRALVVAALDRYRESIGTAQHYTSQQYAMQDALAYATVFVVRPLLSDPEGQDA